MKKYIVTQDVDEVIEFQGSIVIVEPYKKREDYIIGMEFYVGKSKAHIILGYYSCEKMAKAVFCSILGFLNSDYAKLFYMPEDRNEEV